MVDFIDGTTNFIQGIPKLAISIGVVHNLQIQVAVVYDPSRDEIYKRWRSFSDRNKMRNYITGMIGHIEHDISSLRIWNCAALCLAYVACGRTDAHFEPGIHLWDMAAGKLIFEERRNIDLSGQAYQLNQRNIIATNNKLAKVFIKMIR